MERYQSAACAVLFLLAEIVCGNSSIPSPCVGRERQALLEFKTSLHDPSNWLSSWQGDHCCQWEGIHCHNLTGHVVKLDLKTPYLTCSDRSSPHGENECDIFKSYSQYVEAETLNSSLFQLEYLTYLDLSGNDFHGSPIPMFIGSMLRLRYLSLSDANFGGRIPSNLGNLTNLHLLDLSQHDYLQIFETNDINWISGLRSLQYLDMSNIYLGNADNLFQVLNRLPSVLHIYLDDCGLDKLLIPHINLTNAPKLQALSLAANGLRGSVLEALQNLTSLVHLDLSQNYLNSIPSWFHKSEKLEYLDLSKNWLHGSIPHAFRNVTSIKLLYLASNHFASIPSWFRNFEKLVALDLSFNELHGPVPQPFRYMASIELLDLSANYLTSVPSWIVELKRVLDLDLSRNKLTSRQCSLSTILKNMCHLESLDFSNNKLGEESLGSYELSVCIKYDLVYMDLSRNEFNDHLPTWLGQIENLVELNLEGNSFYGSIPSSFGKLSKLKKLMLSNNKLEGALPTSIASLTYLDISNNSFNSTIPSGLGQLDNLWYLNLSSNNLHGSIPANFGQLASLSELDLSSNNLDGTIVMGKEGSSMPHLWYLNLANNQICGSLPKHIGHMMPNLQYLLLGNNLINGSIPNSLCQTSLFNVDLSKNKLSGKIPNCWKDNNVRWESINLSSNKLSGVFPSTIGNLYSLLWLHLNNNSLQGELPVSVRYLKQLLILDLGENQFSGSIPSWTANTFPSLQILRLCKNMLSGSIPTQLCQLSSLRVLDLSHNNLQDSIPWCIGNLRGMTLDKSSDISTRDLAYFMAVAGAPVEQQWSTEDVKEVNKGRELDYRGPVSKIIALMDLSKNNLVGSIPEGITSLNGMHGLNLSNNHLKGEIPKMIGDMKSLESFDVSNNQLSGKIPDSMSALTSLSRLNLAHNNFSGPIPIDYQFGTFDQSSYVGNPYLCGLPLQNKCHGDDSHEVYLSSGLEDEKGKTNKSEKWWFYFVVAVGFATGFWGVIGVLLFKKSWRHAYFRRVEDATNMIYVAIAIKVAKLKKQMVSNGA